MNGINNEVAAVAAVVVLLILVLGASFLRHRPKLKRAYFEKRWKELQVLCGSNNTWPLAIINADKLVDEALKKRRIKGKTMGERLVAAQRTFSDNDALWFAHKLRNRLVHEDNVKLKKKDVQQALLGFRHALKDLGALQ